LTDKLPFNDSTESAIRDTAVHSVNIGSARRLQMQGRSMLSAIGKQAVQGAVPVGRLGLLGDEQADLTLHGGLDKAVYAYPLEHYPFWQTQRRTHSVSLFDEVLAPGFMGENLTLEGLLESDVWIGDELHFAHCILRVTEPRHPCGKLNAVMGYAQASRDMAHSLCSGFYLAVDEPGAIEAGEVFTVVRGKRGLSVADAFKAKRAKHLR
jgi:MOSC domain-containing protein YiiM